ncbi:hypothetical protein ACLKA6_003090 [Drosophila palustris]
MLRVKRMKNPCLRRVFRKEAITIERKQGSTVLTLARISSPYSSKDQQSLQKQGLPSNPYRSKDQITSLAVARVNSPYSSKDQQSLQ